MGKITDGIILQRVEPTPQRTLLFDIETNGFLEDLDTIHSLVIKDIETGTVYSFCDELYQTPHPVGFIEDGVRMLSNADLIVGHNIIKYDIPAIQKVYPGFSVPQDKVFDTLTAAAVIWPDLVGKDMDNIREGRITMPAALAGLHKLDAWGHRLGCWKGDYAEKMKAEGRDPWAEWTPEMQEYCEQDVEVTEKLYRLIQSKNYSKQCLDLEHEVAFVVAQIERNGFALNVAETERFYQDLAREREEMASALRDIFPPWWAPDGKLFVPKKDNAKLGYTAGVPVQKVKQVVFNPQSNQHIARCLKEKYGWTSPSKTPSGQAKIDEEILGDLPFPEAQQLARYKMINKLIGMIAEGDNAWLKLEHRGRIYGTIWQNGTVTGRASHSKPNVGQVPSVNGKGKFAEMKAEFGKRCRACWGKPWQLGTDASSLELRMLAHFMNDPDYTREVIEGDVHTVNQEAAGLPSRDMAKTFIYAFLYGAGNYKLGTIIQKGAQAGGVLRKRFLTKVPALKHLQDSVKEQVKRTGTLRGLDGRILHIRSQHAALNTLLQSAGAIVCKQWMVEFVRLLQQRNLYQTHVRLVAWVHDELQMEIDESLIDTVEKPGPNGQFIVVQQSVVGDLAEEAMKIAEQKLGIRVPLTTDYKVGQNWKDCH